MTQYTLKVKSITPKKRSQLERMLPPSCSLGQDHSDQVSYALGSSLPERQVLKVIKVVKNLGISYQLTKK